MGLARLLLLIQSEPHRYHSDLQHPGVAGQHNSGVNAHGRYQPHHLHRSRP